VPFRDIREIERLDRGSRVRLAGGQVLELRGTNDVDRGHRGVSVASPGLGGVDLPWRLVERVSFAEAPASPPYDAFDGGRPIRGTVRATANRRASGRIVWDRDESFTWETLDGKVDGIDPAIAFGDVRAIELLLESPGVRVELRDGRRLEMTGSSDVSADNRGIVVTAADGTTTAFIWNEVERVELD
jgi:hypothetical protein